MTTTPNDTPAEETQAMQAPATVMVAVNPATQKKKLIWGLILVIAPTVLWIVSLILFAINNIVAGAISADMNSFGDNPAYIVVNILAWFMGAIAFLSWLPGLITGIVLLATRK